MFTKNNLVAILAIALLSFVVYPARADFAAEGLGGKWYQDDYKSGDVNIMDNAYKTVADTWIAMSDFFGGVTKDIFEDAPRMESPAPIVREQHPQVYYEYIPRHTTGYPKWVRRPAK